MAIRVNCRNAECGALLELDDNQIWQRVKCPECGSKLMARPAEFSCSNPGCERFLPYNKATAGKRVKCPDCGTVTRAPEPLATMAKRAAVPRPGAGEGAPGEERPRSRRLSRRRSRLARARRPSRPFFVTVVALCVVAAAFAELVLVSDRFYPWHELAKPLAVAGRFSKALLRESSPLAEQFLFDVEPDLQGDLENGSLSDGFLQEFQTHEVPLSADIAITPEKEGSRWQIADVGSARTYTAEKTDKALNICVAVERYAVIALGATAVLTILFLFGFLARSNLMRWFAVAICLGGAALSGVCSEIILAAGWGALRVAMAVFLFLPGTARWASWRESEPETEGPGT